jgi:hypothetical protein
MIEFTAIESLIMAYSPLVATLIGVVCAFVKMVKNIKQIRADNILSNIEKNAQIQELKNDMRIVLQENYELKKSLKEVLSKIDHVRRD